MPMVTSAYAKGDRKQLKVAINRVLKLTVLVTFLVGIGLAVLADPIMEIVYGGNVAVCGGGVPKDYGYCSTVYGWYHTNLLNATRCG